MDGRFTIKDRHGNDLFFGNGDVVWFPQFDEIDDYRQQLKNIRQLELREDDVILAAYPRSGSHWHNQILHMLMENTAEYVGSLNDDLMDWKPPESLIPPGKPRVLVTYLRFEHLPKQVLEKKVKVVYSYRNPKDSWVSYFNCARDISAFRPYTGTWPHFYDLMMDIGYWYGDWFDHVLSWEKAATENPDLVFLSCYELMKKDPVGQIGKMDKFLGLNRGRQTCEKIAEACQFSKLKASVAKQGEAAEVWKKGADALYRKGEIGDWKNWFTMAQNEQFDAVFQKRMAESKLPFIFQ
ncbi:sulfotransferase 1B1-like [Babylonia areolata]|uniref:sulfotransferase 1B1-like n=1 Tax=Babylonia areolata TaxID=304850 RepID=UPI003FD0F7D3